MSTLFDIQNSFYLGNFNQTINKAQQSKIDSIEKDVFLYRAYIAKNRNAIVISEINDNSHTDLQAVKKLAEYFSDKKNRKKIIEESEKKLLLSNPTSTKWNLILGIMYFYEENYESALSILNKTSDLECLSLICQIYLKINRIDLALKTLKLMYDKDEDCTLTQLTTAMINIYLGPEKLNEAFYIYQELIQKYGDTSLLLNGISVSMICSNKIEDSESFIHQASEKNADQSETLINLIFLNNYLGKQNDITERYLNQLKDNCQDHEYLIDLEKKDEEINHLIDSYLSS